MKNIDTIILCFIFPTLTRSVKYKEQKLFKKDVLLLKKYQKNCLIFLSSIKLVFLLSVKNVEKKYYTANVYML